MKLTYLSLLMLLLIAIPLLAADSKSITVTGKLSRVMAIGGESTGWSIDLDVPLTIDGQPVHSIEVEAPAEKLEPLADKHVSARGRLITRESTERGHRTILKLSRIRELAPAPDKQ